MAKVKLEIEGKDKGASSAVKGVTGSIIKASLVIEGLKIATKALIDIGKKSIEALKKQEQIIAKLNVQTNGNAESIQKWTAEIQNVTTIGDEASQTIASLGLSMGITQDKIEKATQGAIGLAEAYGIDLNTAMKMTAQANEGQYTMLARYIPELRNATSDAEKMAIVQEAMAKGFELAKAKAETFTGKLEQLKNIQGDNLEAFGNIVSIVGKDFVNVMVEGQKALNKFLTDSDNIANITAGFEVIKSVLSDMGGEIFNVLKDSMHEIIQAFKNLTKDMETSINVFDVLAGFIKVLTMSITIGIKFISNIITQFVNLINVVKNVVKAVSAFNQLMADPTSWKQAIQSINDVKDSFAFLAKETSENTADLIATVVDEFKSFPSDVEKSANKYADIFEKTNQKVKDNFKETKDEIIDTSSDTGEEAGEVFKKGLLVETKEMVADWKKSWEEMSSIESFSHVTNQIKKWGDTFLGAVNEILDTAKMAWENYYAEQFAIQQENQEAQLESVDEWANKEMEKQGVRLATKQEQLQEEIATLNEKLATEKDSEARAALEKELNEKQSELRRTQILDAAEKKKDDIQKRAKKKETELKKKQFEENKAWSIAQIWINAASSVMGWWSAFASMGIPGIVLAAVMTAATLAIAGVQTGLVASQTFHGAEGGVIPNGTTTGDRAVTYMNKGEALVRDDDYRALVGMARGGGSSSKSYQIATINMYGVNNPAQFAEQLNDLQRYESNR